MNCCHTFAAVLPPWTLPPRISHWHDGSPIHTAVDSSGVNPTNQTSLGPVLVPVLPATLVKSSCARVPVPWVITLLSIWFICSATSGATIC